MRGPGGNGHERRGQRWMYCQVNKYYITDEQIRTGGDGNDRLGERLMYCQANNVYHG